jgi:hypothetical protein
MAKFANSMTRCSLQRGVTGKGVLVPQYLGHRFGMGSGARHRRGSSWSSHGMYGESVSVAVKVHFNGGSGVYETLYPPFGRRGRI